MSAPAAAAAVMSDEPLQIVASVTNHDPNMKDDEGRDPDVKESTGTSFGPL
jgi:hypothetical protein